MSLPETESVRDRALLEAKRIVLTHLTSVDARVFLFGSRALGAAHPDSDIDIGVLPARPLRPGLLARLRAELEDSSIPYTVDVVDLSETDSSFREKVLQDAVRWTP